MSKLLKAAGGCVIAAVAFTALACTPPRVLTPQANIPTVPPQATPTAILARPTTQPAVTASPVITSTVVETARADATATPAGTAAVQPQTTGAGAAGQCPATLPPTEIRALPELG